MGFFRVLLVLAIIYLVIKYWTRYKLRKMQKDYQKKHNPGAQSSGNKKEGDVSVDYIPDDFKKKANRHASDGEYVDYEEVEK
jgi:hypothetical protein